MILRALLSLIITVAVAYLGMMATATAQALQPTNYPALNFEQQFSDLSVHVNTHLAFRSAGIENPDLCYGWNLGACSESERECHPQGIARFTNPNDGVPWMLMTRKGYGGGQLVSIQLASRTQDNDTRSWFWSNINGGTTDYSAATPPAGDAVYGTYVIDSYLHPGGLQMIDGVAFVALAQPNVEGLSQGAIGIFDYSDPQDPETIKIQEVTPAYPHTSQDAVAVGAMRIGAGPLTGRYIVATYYGYNSDYDGAYLDLYLSSADEVATSTAWSNEQTVVLYEGPSSDIVETQNIGLVESVSNDTHAMYLVMTAGSYNNDNHIYAYRLDNLYDFDPNVQVGATDLGSKTMQDPGFSDFECTGNPYVDPYGNFMVYSTTCDDNIGDSILGNGIAVPLGQIQPPQRAADLANMCLQGSWLDLYPSANRDGTPVTITPAQASELWEESLRFYESSNDVTSSVVGCISEGCHVTLHDGAFLTGSILYEFSGSEGALPGMQSVFVDSVPSDKNDAITSADMYDEVSGSGACAGGGSVSQSTQGRSAVRIFADAEYTGANTRIDTTTRDTAATWRTLSSMNDQTSSIFGVLTPGCSLVVYADSYEGGSRHTWTNANTDGSNLIIDCPSPTVCGFCQDCISSAFLTGTCDTTRQTGDLFAGAEAAYGLVRLNPDYAGFSVRLYRADPSISPPYLDIPFVADQIDSATLQAFSADPNDWRVGIWYDQSGNGRDAIASAAAYRPKLTYANDGSGEVFSLQFDGVDDRLIVDAPNILANSNVAFMTSLKPQVTSKSKWAFDIRVGTTATGAYLALFNDNELQVSYGQAGRTDAQYNSGTMIGTTAFTDISLAYYRSLGYGRGFLGGKYNRTTNTSVVDMSGSTSLNIGRHASASAYYKGSMKYLLIFSDSASAKSWGDMDELHARYRQLDLNDP